MNTRRFAVTILTTTMVLAGSLSARADDGPNACRDLPSQSALRNALEAARGQANGGFNLDMWGTVVNRDASSAPWRSRAMDAATGGRAAA